MIGMANKRMFNMKIVDSDAFLDMPLSTQCLYFHLNMRADDDGFVGNPKRIQRLIGATDDDLKLLIAKRFVLVFDDGVIVIKHWKLHNTIKKDRYTQTVYTDELKQLGLKANKAYTFDGNKMETKCIRNVSTGIDIGIDKDLDKDIEIDKGTVQDKENKRETFVSILADYTNNDTLTSSLSDFIDMRKKMKGFTIRAFKLNLKKLDELGTTDDEKIEIVNTSVENGWKSFYPLKHQSGYHQAVQTVTMPEYWNNKIPEEKQEEPIEKIKRLYRCEKQLLTIGEITSEEFEKRTENYKAMYKDLTGKDIENDSI